jgi:hypothetical protein
MPAFRNTVSPFSGLSPHGVKTRNPTSTLFKDPIECYVIMNGEYILIWELTVVAYLKA